MASSPPSQSGRSRCTPSISLEAQRQRRLTQGRFPHETMNYLKAIQFGFLVTFASSAFAEETLTADQMWQHILVLSRTTSANPGSQDEINRLTALESEADMFWQRFSDSPYVWDVKLILLQTRLDRAALGRRSP